MTRQSRLEFFSNVGVSVLLAVVAIEFSGAAGIGLAILCGCAAALSCGQMPPGIRTIAFGLVACMSVLENRPWFLSESTVTFGLSGLIVSSFLWLKPGMKVSRVVVRIAQVLPLLLVASIMPIISPFLTPKSPKVAFLDGGVWATATDLPLGIEAMATRHQYTYELLRDSLKAQVVSPDDSLDGFDQLLVVTPTTPFDAKFIARVKEWTARGGRLLIVADHTNLFGHQTVFKELTNEFSIKVRPDALYETETNGGVYSNWLNSFAGMTPCSIASGVVPRLKMRGWSEHPDYTATSFFGELDVTSDDRSGNFPVLGSRRFGLGEVCVFTDSTFFANFAINRWSSQMLLGSLFWTTLSSASVILGIATLGFSLFRPFGWIAPAGILIILLSPSVGFRPHENQPANFIVELAPPSAVENDSEERDKGSGSSMLASAYGFDVGIRWSNDAPRTFKEHLERNGINLPLDGDKIPPINIQKLAAGQFYVDRNSFWYGQGVGPLRSKNMENLWRTLGAEIPQHDLPLVRREERLMVDPDGSVNRHEIEMLLDGWALLDQRVVARWNPETSKWLARKEWQLGPWFEKDLVFQPHQ